MNRFLLTGALLLQASLAFASPCISGTLQSYIGLGSGGCEIGSATFANFATAPGQFGATAIDPSSIGVSLAGSDLLFSLNATAGPGSLLEAFFRFTATGQFGAAGISLNGAAASGDGAALGILDFCANGSFAGDAPSGCPSGGQSALAFAVDGASELSSSVAVTAGFFDVFVDLTVDGGSAGSASLESAAVSLSQVPEPSPAWILGAALPILGWLRRKTGK